MKSIAGAILVAGGTIGHAIALSGGASSGDRISGQIPAVIALVVGGAVLLIGLISEWKGPVRASQ